LTYAFGSLGVPLCGKPGPLARVDSATNKIVAILPFGPAESEGGIAASDAIWIVGDDGTLLRIDPADNAVRQEICIPAGSFHPLYSDGAVWITANKSSVLTPVDARTGEAPFDPRWTAASFSDARCGSIWTLNQGDGSVTRADAKTRSVTATIPAGIPGPRGDICFDAGTVWATVFDVPIDGDFSGIQQSCAAVVGAGGDAIRCRHDFPWLTDLRNGRLWRVAPPRR